MEINGINGRSVKKMLEGTSDEFSEIKSRKVPKKQGESKEIPGSISAKVYIIFLTQFFVKFVRKAL